MIDSFIAVLVGLYFVIGAGTASYIVAVNGDKALREDKIPEYVGLGFIAGILWPLTLIAILYGLRGMSGR